MTTSRRRFSLSLVVSLSVTVFLLYLVFSAGIIMGILPVVGIGGVYAEGDSFSGNVGKIYPAYQEGGTGTPGDPITDAPASGCSIVPMIVFDLQNAEVVGVEFRKDVELPFLNNRYASLRIRQPGGSGDPAFFSAQQVKIYITQLRADNLLIRNIELREAGPNGNNGAAGDPKWGPTSGELYVEGGDTENTQDPDGTPGSEVDGLTASNLELWVHGIEGQAITFNSGDQATALTASLEFPTDGQLDRYYNGRLGFDLPEYPNEQNREYPAQETDRDEYFSCTPVQR